jgi:hypothetical protein
MDDVGCLLPWHDADVSVERVGYGLEGVETHRVFALLYSADVLAQQVGAFCHVALCHSSLCAQLGDVLPDALSLLLILYHSSFAFE